MAATVLGLLKSGEAFKTARDQEAFERFEDDDDIPTQYRVISFEKSFSKGVLKKLLRGKVPVVSSDTGMVHLMESSERVVLAS